MAKIYYKLSKKVNKVTNRAEIILRLRNGGDYDHLAKSGLFIDPINFKEDKGGFGSMIVNRRKLGNDISYHEGIKTKLYELETTILNGVVAIRKEEVTKEWLENTINLFLHPDLGEGEKTNATVYELIEEYISKNDFSIGNVRAVRVLSRDIARFEGFVRATENKSFSFDVKGVTTEDIEQLFDYLKNEKDLSLEYPKVFADLVTLNPLCGKGQSDIKERGNNTILKLKKRLKAFFKWLNERGITDNMPFEGLKMGSFKYGTPFYISSAERNALADFPFEDKRLSTQRDIFIFHCLTGCRVSDLVRLNEDNILKGILRYTPHKTKEHGDTPTEATVPLHPKAKELVKKYRGVDKEGRLFPFISPQKYNDALKEIFKIAEINRKVEVKNPISGEIELKPLHEVVSSHLARRTFVGNAYFKVQDPNLIGKMSGHVEGSKAFSRYRKIEEVTLKNVIEQL